MIKIKFTHLNNPAFTESLAKLSQETGWEDFKASYNVAKILRRVSKELNLARQTHLKILEKYAAKGEDGNFLVNQDNGRAAYDIPDDKKKEYDEKMRDFLDTEIELDCHKISTASLGDVKLTPHDITVLEPILDLQL